MYSPFFQKFSIFSCSQTFFFLLAARCYREARYFKLRALVSEGALMRDSCVIPPGRWIECLRLLCCQSSSFEVCQLHKKPQQKGERRCGCGSGERELMSVFNMRTREVFLLYFSAQTLFMAVMYSCTGRGREMCPTACQYRAIANTKSCFY